jgi:hypothetical protein
MKIVGAPEGGSASDFTGYHCVGPKYKTESILVEIQAKVQKNYIVGV